MYAFFEIFMCTLLTYVRTNMQQKVVALCGFLGLKSLSNTFYVSSVIALSNLPSSIIAGICPG